MTKKKNLDRYEEVLLAYFNKKSQNASHTFSHPKISLFVGAKALNIYWSAVFVVVGIMRQMKLQANQKIIAEQLSH
jgi:hypothetical protein